VILLAAVLMHFRYENGKTKPPLALVRVFGLLDRHPDLIHEVVRAYSQQDLIKSTYDYY
jgi:Antitoxin component of bacterial toxin-antitoxin system, MqsA